MIAAAFGYLTPVQGALLQELIDVAVILNALRALRIVPQKRPDRRLILPYQFRAVARTAIPRRMNRRTTSDEQALPFRSPHGHRDRLAARRGPRRQRRHRLDGQPDRRRRRGVGRDIARSWSPALPASSPAPCRWRQANMSRSVRSPTRNRPTSRASARTERHSPSSSSRSLPGSTSSAASSTRSRPQVADQLMAKDALGAHARDELGISEMTAARPIQAALTSAATFAVGAAMPLLMVVLMPTICTGPGCLDRLASVSRASRRGRRAGRRREHDEGDASGHILGSPRHGADRRYRCAVRHRGVMASLHRRCVRPVSGAPYGRCTA